MTEMEKIGLARTYIEKLANGINPLTDQEIPENDSINNVRISRCLFYVADVLKQVQENAGVSQPRNRTKKCAFSLSFEERKRFKYSEAPIPISEITRRINELIDPEVMKKLSYRNIVDWLVESELLTEGTDSAGKKVRRPTYNGKIIGIGVEQRNGASGPYHVVVYSQAAQTFILDNLDAVIARSNTKDNQCLK